LDWVPGNISQAEDRCHRIGQTDSVLVQHIVVDGSIDAHLAKTIVAKQKIINRATNDGGMDPEDLKKFNSPIIPEAPKKNKVGTEELIKKLTPEIIETCHNAIKKIAEMDQDRARSLNGVGFNRYDSKIGHSLSESETLTPAQGALAYRLVNKYKKQLEIEIPNLKEV